MHAHCVCLRCHEGAQQWVAHLGLKPILTDMNCRLWNKDAGVMISKNIGEELVRLTAESADVDLYVCGFMCTPFTPDGLRKAWQYEHAHTCWSILKTISLLRPRAFLLENVMAISNNSNSVVVRSALSKLSKYVVLHLKMNSTHFGVPHHRVRVYVIGFRTDTLKPGFMEFSTETLEAFFQKKVAAMGREGQSANFIDWLSALGFPVDFYEAKPDGPDKECTCALDNVCELHTCQCSACGQHGTDRMKCLWRASINTFLESSYCKMKQAAYLKMWRKVNKDKKLEKVPTHEELARIRKICTAQITSPSRRLVLHATSQYMDITMAKTVLNLGKSIGRTQVRTDGLVPTLGHGCTSLYLPGFGAYITMPQLLALTGLHPQEHGSHIRCAVTSGSDMDIMVGNAMCLPLVGSIIAVALHMMKP